MATIEEVQRLLGKKEIIIADLESRVNTLGPAFQELQVQIQTLTQERDQLKVQLLAFQQAQQPTGSLDQRINGEDDQSGAIDQR